MIRTSVWEKPSELCGRSDVDKLLQAPPKESMKMKNKAEDGSKDEPAAKKQKGDPSLTSILAGGTSTTISLTVRIHLSILIEKIFILNFLNR